MPLLSYSDVRLQLGAGRAHLLLGNGFSIACDPLFAYGSLFDFAAGNGLSDRVRAVFEYLGTNNFEGVLRLLEHGQWLTRLYAGDTAAGTLESLGADLAAVKTSLVSALAGTHFSRPYDIQDARLATCRAFLTPYFNIFSLNYDLLLYWVCMSDPALMRRDCFGSSDGDPGADYCVFSEHLGASQGILFLHGALHLYAADGEVRKHTWCRTGVPLIDSIRAALETGKYPLFVAEGMAQKKKEQIEASSYLSYCLSKLGRIKGPLVVFGWAFAESDRHITDTIAFNTDLPTLYVGLFGDAEAAANRQIRAAADAMVSQRRALLERRDNRGLPLVVHYFDSGTASVWTPTGAGSACRDRPQG